MSKIACVLLLLLNSFPFNPSVFTKDPFLPASFCKSLLKGQEKKVIIGQVSLFQRKTVWRNICETPHVYSLLPRGRLSWGRILLRWSARSPHPHSHPLPPAHQPQGWFLPQEPSRDFSQWEQASIHQLHILWFKKSKNNENSKEENF